MRMYRLITPEGRTGAGHADWGPGGSFERSYRRFRETWPDDPIRVEVRDDGGPWVASELPPGIVELPSRSNPADTLHETSVRRAIGRPRLDEAKAAAQRGERGRVRQMIIDTVGHPPRIVFYGPSGRALQDGDAAVDAWLRWAGTTEPRVNPSFFGAIADGFRRMLAPPGQPRPNQSPRAAAAERFKAAHWGIEADKVYTDPDITGTLVEMGKLRELHVESDDGAGQIVRFPKVNRSGDRPAILAFTPDEAERLHVSQPPALKKRNQNRIDPDGEWYKLGDVARQVGGRQARWGYPAIDVQPLGHCTHVVYATNKEGDGPSEYIHEFAEEQTAQSVCPVLCIDKNGGLWLAGGSYEVRDEGITD